VPAECNKNLFVAKKRKPFTALEWITFS